MICFAHDFIRESGDVSSVSLREINRFSLICYFFKDYYEKKNNYLLTKNKKKNIILN